MSGHLSVAEENSMREAPLLAPVSPAPGLRRRTGRHVAASLLVLQLLAGGAAGAGVMLAADQAHAVQVRTRGGSHADYGRLVFEWPQRTGYNARIDGDRLIVTFDDPIETDLSAAVRQVQRYVTGGQISVDGKTLSFRLSGNYTLATSTESGGKRIVLDLKRGGSSASSASTASAASAPAISRSTGATANAVPVPVRVGQHPEYSRVVFDWPVATQYSISRSGSQASIIFRKPGNVQADAIANMLPRGIGAISATTQAQGTAVLLTVPPTARLRHFKSGNRVVVDVMGSQSAPQIPAATADTSGAVELPPAPSAPAAPARSAGGTGPAEKAANVQALLQNNDFGRMAPQVAANRPGTNDPIRVQYIEGRDGASMAFAWPYIVPMVAFTRGDHLWVVFPERKEFNFEDVDVMGKNFATRHEVLTPEGRYGIVLRFLLPPDQKITTEREGTSWIIRIGPNGAALDDTVEAEIREDSERRPEAFLPTGAVDQVVRIEDPNFNDTLYMFPVQKARFGKEKAESHDDFDLLETAQGFVVVQKNPTTMAMASETGVTIKSPTGLTTPTLRDPGLQDKGADGGEEAELPRLFPLKNWRRGVEPQYFDIYQELSNEIIDSMKRVESSTGTTRRAAVDELNRRRLNLAHFYFGFGLMAESLSLINTITDPRQEGDPGYLDDRVFVAMRGVARLETGDLEGAEKDLMLPTLDGEKEAELWRAMLLYKQGHLLDTATLMKGTNPWIDAYPAPLRWDMRLRGTEAAIETGDQNQIQEYLDALAGDDPDVAWRDRGQYWFARSQAMIGNIDQAINTLDGLRSSPDRWSATRARFDHALLTLERGPLSALQQNRAQEAAIVEEELPPEEQPDPEAERVAMLDEAIRDFERLRWGWRGDTFELRVLQQLGEFYLQRGEYRNALTTWRRIPNYFPDDPASKDAVARMQEVFADLYLRDEADKLPEVTALALFDEFRELVPVGEEGDEMIRKLADRLVKVDLLERAASLLEHQVRFRLDGEQKAQVGARLAVVRLLDDKPLEAEAGLDASEVDVMPQKLREQRARLRARAVYDLDRPREAVDLISDDLGMQAERLRAEFAWGQQRWLEAAIALERILGAGPTPGEPVSEQDASLIVDLAVALTMAGEYEQLDSLYRRFAAQLQGRPQGQALTMLATAPTDTTRIRTIALELSEVKTFQDFMSSYRQAVTEQGLSAATDREQQG